MPLGNSVGFLYCQIYEGEFPKAGFFLPVWFVGAVEAG